MSLIAVIALNWAQSPTFTVLMLWASTWVSPAFLTVFKFGESAANAQHQESPTSLQKTRRSFPMSLIRKVTLKNKISKASDVIHWGKVLATEMDDPVYSVTHMVEGAILFLQQQNNNNNKNNMPGWVSLTHWWRSSRTQSWCFCTESLALS